MLELLQVCEVYSIFAVNRGSTVSANKALELVRAALQPSLNAEIEAVLKSYQEVCVCRCNVVEFTSKVCNRCIMSEINNNSNMNLMRFLLWCSGCLNASCI